MSDVPTVDRASCVQRSCDLDSNQNLSTRNKQSAVVLSKPSSDGHTSRTSFEDFYNYGDELDTRKAPPTP